MREVVLGGEGRDRTGGGDAELSGGGGKQAARRLAAGTGAWKISDPVRDFHIHFLRGDAKYSSQNSLVKVAPSNAMRWGRMRQRAKVVAAMKQCRGRLERRRGRGVEIGRAHV